MIPSRMIFLKGIQEEYIDVLNLMGAGDISQLPFATICDLCRRYSRSRAKSGKGIRDVLPKVTRSTAGGGVSRIELGNLLENFKTKILGTLSSQLDMFQVKKKQEEEKVVVYIFCPHCRKKHASNECPLDNVQVCAICVEDHETENFPSLPRLKAIYKENREVAEPSFQAVLKKPWKPRAQGMSQDPFSSSFSPYNAYQQQWNTQIPWKNTWPQQQTQTQPWQQNWRGNPQGMMPQQQFPMPYPNYPQYPPPMPSLYPPTQTTVPQLPQLTANQNPPRPTQMPAQPGTKSKQQSWTTCL
jgi:hypothetical protein